LANRVPERVSFGILIFAQLVATMGFTFVMPFMPLYVQELGVESERNATAWAGVLNGAAGLTMALAAPLWGRLADRVGRKAMLMRATLAASVVVGLMGFVTGPWQLLALRLVQGTLTGTVPAATALVATNSPAGRVGGRLGALQMTVFVAGALGPLLGGMFYDFAGIRSSFALTSGMLAVSGMAVLFGVYEARPSRGEGSAETGESRSKIPYRALLPAFAALLLAHVTITGANVNIPGFLASLGVEERVASQSGRLMAAAALFAAVGSAVGGRVAGRLGSGRVISALLLLAGITAMPQALAGNLPELWAFRLSSGFFLGALIPVANLYIKDTVPESRQGAAFGVASSAVAAGFALGPMGGGLLVAYLGFWAPFFVPGALLVGASVAVFALSGGSRRRLRAACRAAVAHLVRSC
jgi:MFS transporter, DHA1 family, multidrug resistance protein